MRFRFQRFLSARECVGDAGLGMTVFGGLRARSLWLAAWRCCLGVEVDMLWLMFLCCGGCVRVGRVDVCVMLWHLNIHISVARVCGICGLLWSNVCVTMTECVLL